VPRYKKTQHVINPVSIRRNDEKGREMRFRIAAVAPVIWLMTSTGIALAPSVDVGFSPEGVQSSWSSGRWTTRTTVSV
jgi:hypothetical protein